MNAGEIESTSLNGIQPLDCVRLTAACGCRLIYYHNHWAILIRLVRSQPLPAGDVLMYTVAAPFEKATGSF